MPRCPGQDQRYWLPEDIFDVKCPSCGNEIEFWKDEPLRICSSCEKEVRNPRIDLGCAKWCKYAKECLGKMPGDIPAYPLFESLKYQMETLNGVSKENIQKAEHISCMAEKEAIQRGGEIVVVKSAAFIAYILTNKPIDLPSDFLKDLPFEDSLNEKIKSIVDEVISGKSPDNIEAEIVFNVLK